MFIDFLRRKYSVIVTMVVKKIKVSFVIIFTKIRQKCTVASNDTSRQKQYEFILFDGLHPSQQH